jgi:hypothetical protein
MGMADSSWACLRRAISRYAGSGIESWLSLVYMINKWVGERRGPALLYKGVRHQPTRPEMCLAGRF